MVLRISPNSIVKVAKDEEVAFTLDCTDELRTNTVSSVTMVITDSLDADVTTNFGGGVSESSGIVTFGIKGYDDGEYKIIIEVTCNEQLPDATSEQFRVRLTLSVDDL